MSTQFCFDEGPDSLSQDERVRHEGIVDLFGRFLMWHRNQALRLIRRRIEDEDARSQLAATRRGPYEGVAHLDTTEKNAVCELSEEALNCFIERFVWALGDEGVDASFGPKHAFRVRLQFEVVDVQSGEVVEDHSLNRGGKRFFGSYWGRWLNRYGKSE